MVYAVIKNGKYTGVFYENLTEAIILFHLSQGEIIKKSVTRPQPIGYDKKLDLPIYASVTFEEMKQAKLDMLKALFELKIVETDYLLLKAQEFGTTPAELNLDKWQERLSLRANYETKEAALQAATTQEELDKIDINL